MSVGAWLLVVAATALVLYALLVAALVAAGRRGEARAVAGFVPDCVVLLTRLLADPRVPRRRKALVAVALLYLATPLDLVPDFIPIAGQLDDAILVAFVLRRLLSGTDEHTLHRHWPGPEASLAVVRRLAYGRPE